MVFLDQLESGPSFLPATVKAFDDVYSLSKTENAEIKLRFLQIALNSGPEYAEQAAGAVPSAAGCSYRLTRRRMGEGQRKNEVLPPYLSGPEREETGTSKEDFLGTRGLLRGQSRLTVCDHH